MRRLSNAKPAGHFLSEGPDNEQTPSICNTIMMMVIMMMVMMMINDHDDDHDNS